MKNILLIILSVFLTSCSKYFVEEKHGVKIDGLSVNYFELKIGFIALLIGLILVIIYLYIESKFEDTENSILKFIKAASIMLGSLILIIGGFFLLPLFALIEYIGWYLFAGFLLLGFLITIFKK
ncbi:hypothetical protein [Flavobacterium oreochromis]|uniref:hypothetical protein n=1 Tax=Flavobacterium oreochromis TaxID=2906078 RepID=UPI000B4D2C4D|nr:hypothetical protein [Flavobacterium oreochromis]OWP75508.1 hypothetical protein BWG23_10715 [Flavobacterium oreochromis]